MSKDEKRFCQLAWQILEHKCRYYVLVKEDLVFEKDVIPDAEYDALEDEYRQLAVKTGRPTTAADMVGFDLDRGSCRLVYSHLKSKRIKE